MSAARRREPGAIRAVLFDLDGTLTKPRSSWQAVHEALGLWSGAAEAHQRRFHSGSISYEEFCRLDAMEWRGMPLAKLAAICDAIPSNAGAAELLAGLRRAGVHVGIVSTGLSLLVERIRREHALDYSISNEILAEGGWVTGEVSIRVAHGEKDRALLRFCEVFSLRSGEVACVGDTEGDISMFREAGFSIAFNPDGAKVREAADVTVEGADLSRVRDLLMPGIGRDSGGELPAAGSR